MERVLSLLWQSSWIRPWTVTGSLCSMTRLDGCFMLRKITKHITLFYLRICQKSFKKARKISVAWSILPRKLLSYILQLTRSEIQQSCLARDLTKVFFAALKDKKALTTIMKENLGFKQLRLNYLNKQKTKKEHLRLV